MPKRAFDLSTGLIGLALLLPIFLLIALAIRLESPGPIFFRQIRVGARGVHFRIHKFRTMRPGAEALGSLTIGEDSRITRVGGFLRKYKLDELPQLIDVLVGNMSLVGPRPEVPEYIAHYSESSRTLILSVKPGMTDRASLKMIDENKVLASYEEPHSAYVREILPMKERYYLDYVRNRTFWGDLSIIGQTLVRLIR